MDYLLHLADSALIIGQRNAEWCGQGPVLEEDIALANISLDHIGQARMLYQLVAEIQGGDATEDGLAYFRGERDYRNYTLLELPHHAGMAAYARTDRDYAVTIVRNFLYSTLMLLVWDRLQSVANEQVAAIAAKSLKEARYHVRHSADWLVRLGDGTAASKRRMQAALEYLMPFTQEFWTPTDMEKTAAAAGCGLETASLKDTWTALVSAKLAEATLTLPVVSGYVTEGKLQRHSEHLGYVLAEMQSLARAHPEAVW
ncbi:MAG: phenylacetate-CoA oxygenase subunit PaaC [Neisseriaceae bacterium]|nr:phenylacetate-CoA oxygenase subunit PaaC [Neisseriaceae bacterium]